MKNQICKIKKINKAGYIGIETAIVGALIVIFSILAYNYLLPSFEGIAISIKNSVSGTY